jgi:hypothetical protein
MTYVTLAAISLHFEFLFLEGSKSSRFSRYLTSWFQVVFWRMGYEKGSWDVAEEQIPMYSLNSTVAHLQ